MKGLCLSFAALLVAACAHTPTAPPALPAGVELVGDVYYIPGEGVEVNGEGGLGLEPGAYRFAADTPGRRLRIHVVEIDDRAPRLVRVEPGPAFALVELAFTPEPDAVVVAEARSPAAPGAGLDPPWRVELDAGRYRLEARAEGHLPLAREFDVPGDGPLHLDLRFTPNPTRAPLLVTTTPAGAEIFIDGARLGEAPQSLEALEFGTHRVSAYSYSDADADDRVAFEGDHLFTEDSPRRLELTLDVEQRRFDGEWYPRAVAERMEADRRLLEEQEARRAEERAYRRARVDDPLEIRVELSELADKAVTTLDDFSRALFMVLRVGDRLRVDLDGAGHLVWKRSPRAAAAFRAQVEALWNDRPVGIDHADDPVTSVLVEPGSSLITTVAYRLYRRINEHPIVDLGAAMHDLPGVSVHTLAADGGASVLTFGGGNVAVNGRPVESTRQLGLVRLDAADRALDLTWDEAPQRVLVVSERNAAARPVLPSAELNLNQKHVVELGVDGRVRSFHRFTEHPDGGWRHLAKERGSGLAASIDLDADEVGPHEESGGYRRDWLIDYETADGRLATRQVSLDYTVGDEVQAVESPVFIRRQP